MFIFQTVQESNTAVNTKQTTHNGTSNKRINNLYQ